MSKLSLSDIVEFDLDNLVPHAPRHEESISRFAIGNTIQNVIFVITTAPDILLVED